MSNAGRIAAPNEHKAIKNYLDGFSDNVKEIIEKFVSEEINLSPDDRSGIQASV